MKTCLLSLGGGGDVKPTKGEGEKIVMAIQLGCNHIVRLQSYCQKVMGWWGRYRARRERRRAIEDEREERALERMRRSDDAGGLERIASIAEALGSALGRTFEIESKLLADMGGFLGVLQEASAKKAAAVLGSRGGRSKAANRKKRLAAPQCPLCSDPMRRDVTWQMVEAHRQHGDNGNGAAPDEQPN